MNVFQTSRVRFSVVLATSFISISAFSNFASAADEKFGFTGPFASVSAKAKQILESFKEHPQIQAALEKEGNELTFLKHVRGEGVETFKFKQTFRGIEVVGAQAHHHEGAAGEAITSSVAAFDLSAAPTLSADEAVALAQSLAGDRELFEAPKLKILAQEEGRARLTWWIELEETAKTEGRKVILDAHSGQVIANVSVHQTIAPVYVYSTAGMNNIPIDPSTIKGPADMKPEWNRACQLIDVNDGAPLSIALKNCDRVVSNGIATLRADAQAKEAATNAKAVLEYFLNVHGRDSFDDKGSPLVSAVHVGERFENAFWNTRARYMGYGDGDGINTASFTHAADVAGHEMTHGVIGETADLLPMDEPGALNEAYADFFGLLISKSTTWELGKELSIDPTRARAIRNLANPNDLVAIRYRDKTGKIVSKPYPAHVNQQFPSAGMDCNEQNDSCWVHVNSTIPGHASYRVFKALGQAKAEKLYYLVLTQYLMPNSTFKGAADATRQACRQTLSTSDCALVDQAFIAVGL